MKTEHLFENAILDVVHVKLRDPEWNHAILECLHRLQTDFFHPWYQSMIHQVPDIYNDITVYDAYAFYCVHMELGVGKIVYAKVNLGVVPCKDKNVNEMNKRLSSLHSPFNAMFTGGTQGEDGIFTVNEPRELSITTFDGREINQTVSGDFPLEVGYLDAIRTLVYLNTEPGRIARWPYNSKDVYLLCRVENI